MSDSLTARLLAEIERRENEHRVFMPMRDIVDRHRDAEPLAYLAALREIVEHVGGWRHRVDDNDCWYTCPAATEERDGDETCDEERLGGPCDCGLKYRQMQILEPIAKALGVEVD